MYGWLFFCIVLEICGWCYDDSFTIRVGTYYGLVFFGLSYWGCLFLGWFNFMVGYLLWCLVCCGFCMVAIVLTLWLVFGMVFVSVSVGSFLLWLNSWDA